MIYSPTKPPVGTQIDWTDPLAQGLVGCWLFNEGGGSTAKDLCGKYHGTLNGCTWTPSGLYFNGTSDYVALVGTPIVDWYAASSGVTIFAKCSGGTATDISRNIFSMWYSGATNHIFSIGQVRYSPFGRMVLVCNADSGMPNPSEPITGATALGCTSVCGTYKNLSGTIWTDKNTAVTDACGVPVYATLNSSRIGHGGGARYAGYWLGIISTIMVYNRALSAQEIQRLHELTKGW